MNLSVIIPVLNEVHGLEHLLPQLIPMKDIHEILVVDDGSVDGSPDLVSALAADNPKVVLLERKQRGLGSAIRHGAQHCTSRYAIVMDGDGQHRVHDLAALLNTYQTEGEPDTIVIGSRFLQRSRIQDFPLYRLGISKILNACLKLTIRGRTSDPLSGFFGAPVHLIAKTRTNGFKVLYDLLIRSPHNPCTDVPIEFSGRIGGASKAQAIELFQLMKTMAFFYRSRKTQQP